VGYERESSNYRLYNPHTGKIIVSRDVSFNESRNKKISLTSDEVSLPFENNPSQKDRRVIESLLPVREPEKVSDDENPEEEIHQEDEMQSRHLRDRSKIKKPERYEANLAEVKEPMTFSEATTGENAEN